MSCAVLCCVVLRCHVLCCDAVRCNVVLCGVALRCVALRCVVLCCVVLCGVVWCYVVRRGVREGDAVGRLFLPLTSILSPIDSIAKSPGPIKTMPSLSTRLTKAAFSDRKP
jgi:hypothetical protein